MVVNWTIGRKLWLLSFLFIFTIVVVASVSAWNLLRVVGYLDRVVDDQLPAVRNMTLADMMHDGIRANVFHAIITSGSKDPQKLKEVKDEAAEFATNIKEYLGNLAKMNLSAETQSAIAPAIPEVNNYVAVASSIVDVALAGEVEKSLGMLPKFQQQFEVLEELLGTLGDRIAKEAESVSAEGKEFSHKAILISAGITCLGIIAGFIFAFLILRNLLSTLRLVIDSLSASSKTVSRTSASAETSAATLSEAATEQAASLQQTMASAEEISAMISQNAESATKAKQTVEANDQATKAGSVAVVEMVAAIGEIKSTNEQILHQMQSSNKEFGEIVQIISEIGDKTKVINDIVFQTKLLSFNASVEAARAGEHGKGFAVVAEEVGNLAQMSGNAAKEITDMLSASIKRVNAIVEQTKSKVEQLVEVGKDKVSMGQSTAERCRLALEELSRNASTLTSMVTEIAQASKEQAQGVREINTAIAQLDQVTQQNSAVAQQSSAQADSLLRETHSLDASVTQLVEFVHGRHGSASQATGGGQLEEREKLTARSESPSKHVVSINAHRNKETSRGNSLNHGAGDVKMASGSDVSPSNNNPGFKDF
jgi:methyl-accepting chemotaxis protein